MAKRVIDFKDIDYIRTELFYIRAMSDDDKVRDRLHGLLDFVEEALVDHSRDIRNEMKRDVYKKIKEAKDKDEANKWYEAYKQIDIVYPKKTNERISVRSHYGR